MGRTPHRGEASLHRGSHLKNNKQLQTSLQVCLFVFLKSSLLSRQQKLWLHPNSNYSLCVRNLYLFGELFNRWFDFRSKGEEGGETKQHHSRICPRQGKWLGIFSLRLLSIPRSFILSVLFLFRHMCDTFCIHSSPKTCSLIL